MGAEQVWGCPGPIPSEENEPRSAGRPRNLDQGQHSGRPAAASRRKETMPRQTLRIRDDHDLRTVFECFDLDESGTIDVRVIPEMIRTLMYEVPAPQQVQDLLAKYDADGSGSLDFSEFQALLQDYAVAVRHLDRADARGTWSSIGEPSTATFA